MKVCSSCKREASTTFRIPFQVHRNPEHPGEEGHFCVECFPKSAYATRLAKEEEEAKLKTPCVVCGQPIEKGQKYVEIVGKLIHLDCSTVEVKEA